MSERISSAWSVSHIEGKANMAPLMLSAQVIIYPHQAAVIHRAAVEEYRLPLPIRREREAAAVPHLVVPFGQANAGQLRLIGKGHGDLPVKHRPVKGKIPLSIQVHPPVPPELGTGIFRSRNAHDPTSSNTVCSPSGSLPRANRFSPQGRNLVLHVQKGMVGPAPAGGRDSSCRSSRSTRGRSSVGR